MNNGNNNTAVATTTPKTADELRAELATLDQQRAAAEEQLRAAEANGANGAADAAKAGEDAGKRNIGKVVGKVAIGTGVVGVLAIAGVYAYRMWKSTRG